MYKKILSDFSAGLDLSCAQLQLGLDSAKTAWADAVNVELLENKGLCRQKGCRLITTAPDAAHINSLYTFSPPDKPGFEKILYSTANGDFYEYDCFFDKHTLKKSGMAENSPCIYVNYLAGVVVSNGVEEPFFYDKNGEIQPTNTVAKDGGKIIATAMTAYKSRLWLAMGDSLYYSALGTYDDWETDMDAGYISNFHCDSAPVTALAPYKDYIAVYKKNQTYLLSGSSPDDFAIQPFADKGAAGPLAVVSAANKQFFFSGALFALEQTGILAQISLGAEASLKIKPGLATLDKTRLNEICALSYEPANQIWFFLPDANCESLQKVWIFDYINSAWTKRLSPLPVSCAANFNDEIITATSDGRILLENSGSSFDGLPIEFEWKSPFLTLGEVNEYKRFYEFYFLVSDSVDNNFNLEIFKDYDSTDPQDAEQICVSSRNNMMWHSDTLQFPDSGYWEKLWAVPCEVAQKAEISGSCISVQFRLSGSSLEHNLALLALQFKEIVQE